MCFEMVVVVVVVVVWLGTVVPVVPQGFLVLWLLHVLSFFVSLLLYKL